MRALNDREIQLLVGFLDDEDPRSQELVCRQIVEQGKTALPYLEEAYSRKDPHLRHTLDALVRDIHWQELEKDFRAFAAERDPGLEHGSFLISRVVSPSVDEKKYGIWLDAVVRAVSPMEPAASDHEIILQRLNEYFFKTLGFRGNRKNYYDPSNSAIDRVIETRQGIPISLSILYLLLSWRLKLPVSGVGLPAHFLVRFDGGKAPLFIDPFYNGRVLTRQGCRQLLHSMGYGFREEYLFPISNRDILTRMARNLILLYQRAGQSDRMQQLSSLLEILLARKSEGQGSGYPPPGGRSTGLLQ